MGLENVVLVCFFLVSYVYCTSVKDVILMHGLFEHPSDMFVMRDFIKKAYPNMRVHVIKTQYSGYDTLDNMWNQTFAAMDQMVKVMKSSPNGVHLVCYSQGGLICRAVSELYSEHNIHNFVALSSPLAGQFGDTKDFDWLPNWVRKHMYTFFYSERGQRWSIGNYWNDPNHQKLYLEYCDFLPYLNNEKITPSSPAYKKNFEKLRNLVLVGGPNDGIICPWQSSQFGMFHTTTNKSIEVSDRKYFKWYKDNLFGLRTLDERGAIHTYTVSHIQHHYWIRNETIFQKYVAPWLAEPEFTVVH